jgi:citrate synthase
MENQAMKKKDTIRTDIAWSNEDRIMVHGLDLPSEIIGKFSLGDFAFLELTGRKPNEDESIVFNALAVTLVEHGLTPSVLSTRLTYLGAPESLQGAVAAGLLGLGNTFAGTMEGAAKVLQVNLNKASDDIDLDAVARSIVKEHRANKRIIPGIGHNLHKKGDPRTPAAEKDFGKRLPINATGAIGAIGSELGLPWNIMRGIAVIARSIGLVAHLLEEAKNPMAKPVWDQTEEQATKHMRGK